MESQVIEGKNLRSLFTQAQSITKRYNLFLYSPIAQIDLLRVDFFSDAAGTSVGLDYNFQCRFRYQENLSSTQLPPNMRLEFGDFLDTRYNSVNHVLSIEGKMGRRDYRLVESFMRDYLHVDPMQQTWIIDEHTCLVPKHSAILPQALAYYRENPSK